MGCDIHAYTEQQIGNRWVSNQEWTDPYNEGVLDVEWEKRFTNRNYQLFGLLADVRTDTGFNIPARGLPLDMSPEVKRASEHWGCDGHSHSFFTLQELRVLKEDLASKTVEISGMKDADEVAALKESLASDNPDYSLLYPYAGWTNQPNYVEFEVEVPALVTIGIEPFIEYVETAGDNSRVVFWFDN